MNMDKFIYMDNSATTPVKKRGTRRNAPPIF